MGFKYKMKDVMQALKDKGYTPTRLRKEKILGEAAIQKIRHGELPSWETVATLCELLECDIGNLLTYDRTQPREPAKPRGINTIPESERKYKKKTEETKEE